ncbi:VanZ family protein [Streptomyces sp. NPDC020917]|uniref:VanZ family protein n=1 Tax=Streptomyces sp. NPDC020917 TaxID=3365102 RepID=UPI0037978140
MDHNAFPPAPVSRTGRILLAVLATLGAAMVAFLAQRPLTAPGARRRPGGWHLWFGTINGVVLLTLAALSLAALAVSALARLRGAGGTPQAWRKSLAEVAMVYGTAPWVWMTMVPGDESGHAPRRVNLVPLRDLFEILAGGPASALVQIGGNLLVFAALGFFAPLRFASLASVPRMLTLGAACSTLIEVAQYVLQLNRVSSIDDVLLNATGAALATLASRPFWHPTRGPRGNGPAGDL